MGRFFLKAATSRVGIVVMVFAALLAWHKLDKSSAAREAVVEYVADVELAAAEAERENLQDRLERAREANDALQARITESEKEASDAEAEIRRYIKATDAPDGCRADPGLLERLRAN